MDAFADIAKWHEAEALFRECEFVVASRPGYSLADVANALPESLRPRPEVTKRFHKHKATGDLVLKGATIHLLGDLHQPGVGDSHPPGRRGRKVPREMSSMPLSPSTSARRDCIGSRWGSVCFFRISSIFRLAGIMDRQSRGCNHLDAKLRDGHFEQIQGGASNAEEAGKHGSKSLHNEDETLAKEQEAQDGRDPGHNGEAA